jgi:hypothetical protein
MLLPTVAENDSPFCSMNFEVEAIVVGNLMPAPCSSMMRPTSASVTAVMSVRVVAAALSASRYCVAACRAKAPEVMVTAAGAERGMGPS